MIDLDRLNQEWIETVSKDNRKADKILIEKVIRAFLLLEGLAKSDIPFVFKGGTSLMLLTNSSRRLSVDIDIIIPEPIDDLDIRLDLSPINIINFTIILSIKRRRKKNMSCWMFYSSRYLMQIYRERQSFHSLSQLLILR